MSEIFHVIKDPVHGTMQFTTTEDAWIKPFIDSPNFQRLRHIKQLGLGDYIFPGAVHSRFNHSLGCCYVGSQIAHKIGLNDTDRQLVMIACLLHDIGHGPFSHTFEWLFQDNMIRHEDWTPYFLKEYASENFYQSYNQKNVRHPLDQEKFTEIENMIMHGAKGKKLLADIVSSQLDADRFDYLLRDNHFCGVRYGEFDFRWMIHCMAIVQANGERRLGITYKGIGVVEHYLMARRLMMRNIYHSHKKLAFEVLLVALLANLATSLDEVPHFQKILDTTLGKFLLAVKQFNQQTVKDKPAFLAKHYADYKELCDYDVFAAIRQLAELNIAHEAVEIAKRLHYRIMPKIVRLDHKDLAVVDEQIREFKRQHQAHFHDWQIKIIQTPHQAYSEEEPILMMNEFGNTQPIENFSMMLSAISDRLEHTVFLMIDSAIREDKRISALLKSLNKEKMTPNLVS